MDSNSTSPLPAYPLAKRILGVVGILVLCALSAFVGMLIAAIVLQPIVN